MKTNRTIAEKIFDEHIIDDSYGDTKIIKLDRVFAHEITTPTALKDLEAKGMDKVFDPEKIKVVIDHVTPSTNTLSAIQSKVLRDWANNKCSPKVLWSDPAQWQNAVLRPDETDTSVYL